MNKKGMIGILIGVVLVVIIIGLLVSLSFTSMEDETITIKDKERVTDGDSSYYLIFTEGEVFKNSDSFVHGKFDSSDIYNELDVGKTYAVEVNWFRPSGERYAGPADRANQPESRHGVRHRLAGPRIGRWHAGSVKDRRTVGKTVMTDYRAITHLAAASLHDGYCDYDIPLR